MAWDGGMLEGRLVVVVFAEKEPDTIRVISLRKADKDESSEFEEAIQD